MRYAVIMAGGSGTRLWPLSRKARPKQLLPLVNGKSLLRLAYDRLEGLFPPSNVLVITSAEYADQVGQCLSELPKENIIGEPQGRDTANAIALGAELLSAKDPDATMAVFTADHVIRPAECFQRAVKQALQAAEDHPQALVTFGIRPSWPHTGLGYIHCGGASGGVYEVLGFKEKPDHQTARRYVESGQYFWNSGMFVWKTSAIRSALSEFLPATTQELAAVGEAARKGRDYQPALNEAYGKLERISIDYAVMEKASQVLMAELSCEWLDVGSWPALEDVVGQDDSGNVVVARNVAMLDAFRNVIVTEDGHLIAVLGVDDCIIVHSADATLVCNKAESQRLKELVQLVERKFGGKGV